MLLAARKVGMDLAGEERVLGDVRSAGVIIEGEESEPDDSGDDAEKGEEIRQAHEKQPRIVPQIADCSWHWDGVSGGLF